MKLEEYSYNRGKIAEWIPLVAKEEENVKAGEVVLLK